MGFRDMQEQGTFHEGREYERKIAAKKITELEAELANEKTVAAKAYTACGNYQQRITEIEDYLIEFGDHKYKCLAIATNNKEHCTCGFEQALKGK